MGQVRAWHDDDEVFDSSARACFASVDCAVELIRGRDPEEVVFAASAVQEKIGRSKQAGTKLNLVLVKAFKANLRDAGKKLEARNKAKVEQQQLASQASPGGSVASVLDLTELAMKHQSTKAFVQHVVLASRSLQYLLQP